MKKNTRYGIIHIEILKPMPTGFYHTVIDVLTDYLTTIWDEDIAYFPMIYQKD